MHCARCVKRGGSAMYQMLRLTIVAIAVAFVSFPASVSAQVVATQIKLTEKHVEGFIAAQKGMSAVVEKIQSAAFSGQVNAKYQAELEAVTKSTDSRILRSTRRSPPTSGW